MTKTLTFAAMHFAIAFTVAYVMTGSLLVGGAVAAVEPAVNTVAFFFHERLWSRVEAARAVSVGTSPAAMSDLCA
ncbi:MAG: membrane protein [Gammaproteobacteria bacterium BRH_c0]|nr:MAG: membrane protein [Gammaproteobacteria bacterium BRH_c0]